MRVSLPPLVGFGFIGEKAIFLDGRSDRYWLLPDASNRALLTYCSGEPPTSDEADLIGALVRIGLLEPGEMSPAAPCEMPSARMSHLDARGHTTPSSVILAWSKFAVARWRLRTHGLQGELARITRLRDRRSGIQRLDVDRRARAFAKLRLLVGPTGRCLPLSLALVTWCAADDVRLVFGVKLNPFAAHAWVQRDDEVLADEHHIVREFTPVLVV